MLNPNVKDSNQKLEKKKQNKKKVVRVLKWKMTMIQ